MKPSKHINFERKIMSINFKPGTPPPLSSHLDKEPDAPKKYPDQKIADPSFRLTPKTVLPLPEVYHENNSPEYMLNEETLNDMAKQVFGFVQKMGLSEGAYKECGEIFPDCSEALKGWLIARTRNGDGFRIVESAHYQALHTSTASSVYLKEDPKSHELKIGYCNSLLDLESMGDTGLLQDAREKAGNILHAVFTAIKSKNPS